MSDETQQLQALAQKYDCAVVADIPGEWLDRQLVKDIPVDFLRAAPMLPVRKDGQCYVCTPDPTVETRFPELALLLGGSIEPLLCPAPLVRQAIDRVFAKTTAPSPEPPSSPATPVPAHRVDRAEEREDLLRQADGAPVAARVSRLLLDGLAQNASDIHIEPLRDHLQIRLRIDGVLYPHENISRDIADAVVSRIKIMARLDVAERRLPQDGNARVRVGDREVDIRVSSLPVAEGERLVLRLLGRESTHLTLAQLGIPERLLAPFRDLIRRPYGVIWVTGPTGSGKTTTLYAALRELDTRARNILTIEDPVEYQLPNIGQVGVQSRVGLTFAAGLRALLRQDPDVILVGETRDEETAEIVVRASMTGHLVFSTLHANDAISASLRIVDMGVQPYLVAEATRGALAQRLVRKLCPHCLTRQPCIDPPAPLAALRGQNTPVPTGCPACREGYSGRVGLYELLLVNETIRDAMRTGNSIRETRRIAAETGFQDLWADGRDKIQAGITSVEEVRNVLGALE